MLINKKKVKEFTLEVAKGRAHQFTRVGNSFLIQCEATLKRFIADYVRRVPSKGKTIL